MNQPESTSGLAIAAAIAIIGFALTHAGAAAGAGPTRPDAYLIRNVRIFDGRSEVIARGEVLVVGDRIQAVSRQSIAPPADVNVRVLDGRGRLLTPGFIDAHVHMTSVLTPDQMRRNDPSYAAAIALRGAQQALMRGFTTQRDTGGGAFGLKKAIDEGYAIGPRVYPSGATLTQTAGHGDDRFYIDLHRRWGGAATARERRGASIIADGVPEVLAAAREQLRRGAVQIKVMGGGGASSEYDPLYVTQYTSAEIAAAVDAAASFGTYVTVHSYNSTATRRAIEAGALCIEHGHLIDERTMKLLAERGVFLSTNVVLYETLPPGLTDTQQAKFLEVQSAIDTMMRLAKKHGVKIAFGTDLINGLDMLARQNREFTLRSRWFSPVEILRQATSVNAELLALTGPRNPYPAPLGVVAPNAYADLLLINGDPLSDISILEHSETALALIMKGGQIYKDETEDAGSEMTGTVTRDGAATSR